MDHNSMETYFGLIKTPHDALIIFEACHLGIISRVHRRLSDIERQCVRSGSVYCFDEREAGMRRWTDGKSWSPSRVTGSFLTYRELDESHGNGGKNVYRPDGLLKQSFSITTADNKKLHLISYYTSEDVTSERLFETPSRDPRFAQIVIPKGIYPETSPHADSHSHSASSTNHSSPSPPTRTRHRPHHRAFLHKDDDKAEVMARRPEPSTYNPGHRRNYSGSMSFKDHRYSPIQANFPDSRSRSNSQNVAYPPSLYGSYGPGPEKRHKSTSPSAASSFPTPPFNAYSPSTSWASDDDQPLVSEAATEDRSAYRDDELAPVMIPALREMPLLATGFDHRKAASTSDSRESYSPAPASAASSNHEQDSLSVLANLATDTLLLPKLEPKEMKERVRWVEDDRQLRALSSMLRL
ncbi:hypothetical protein BGX21_009552 [Mortierella sp. AD011]|nr:hypothetical protein BGX20_008151 [Mortierella sp. AD010]KAF9396398.1 hypothetical protein BGX21_009552 [Mortierella sp. AD011]